MIGMLSAPVVAVRAQQVVKDKQVPQEIRDDFGLRFNEAEGIVWLKEGDEHFGAKCKVKGNDVEVVYSANDGQWVQTTEDIAYTALPDQARAYCREKYPDYAAELVQKVSTRRYGILFEIRIGLDRKKVMMTFDMHGKLLEEKEGELETATDDPAAPSAKEKLQGMFKKQG